MSGFAGVVLLSAEGSAPHPALRATFSPQAGRGDTSPFSPPRGEKVPKADEGLAQRLADAIAHRGDDAHGHWSEGSTTLVHALLRTTPEDTQQPFVDDDLVVAADARIDNRAELAARDESDAAVIAAAYRRWGVDCARHLEGDFAFAVWDRRTRTLFCARDAFGVKPFVYAFVPGKLFAFGSVMRAVLAVAEVPDDLDEQRIADFLSFYFDDNERTFLRAVKRLPGGSTLVLSDGAVTISRYWNPREVRPLRLRGGDAAYAEGFREHFTRAVRDRMRVTSPAALGSMLSGGLDSTSIACVARDAVVCEGGPPLPAFSWIFSDFMDADEREFQEAVIAAGGMRAMTLDSAAMHDNLLWSDLDAYLEDGPLYATNYYLNSEAARLARSIDVRVLLDGLGGDSTVSRGPGRFVELLVRGKPLTLVRELRALGARRGAHESLPYLFLSMAVSPLMPHVLRDAAGRLRRRSTDPGAKLLSPRLARMTGLREFRRPRYATARQEHLIQVESPMLAEGLEMMDRLLARHGVEGRYPYFDKRLAEYCLSLPADQKMADGYSRVVVRRAMEGIVPDAVRWRAGKGAPGLHIRALMRASRAELDALFLTDAQSLSPYVDIDVLRAAVADLLEGRPVEAKTIVRLWCAAVLGRWLRARSTKSLSPATTAS